MLSRGRSLIETSVSKTRLERPLGQWRRQAPATAAGSATGRESAFETVAKSAIPRGFGLAIRGKFAGFPPILFPLT
jgi:hypothetical protein